LCRAAFIFFNKSAFSLQGVQSIFLLFFYGIRFDLSAIFFSNALFIFLSLLPFPFIHHKYYQRFLKYLFIITNSFFILLNLVDIAYFPFIHKRMQFDAFRFLNGDKGTEFYKLLPTLLLQYWYVIIVYVIIIYSIIIVYNKTTYVKVLSKNSFKEYAISTSFFILGIGMSVIAMRGGLQLKPLSIINATEVVEVKNTATVLNTPFSIINTFKRKRLRTLNYVKIEQLDACFNSLHTPSTNIVFNKQNVVVIIVESLSNHYLGYFNGDAKTPFLDSLFSQSLVFNNGFANATESIQGIPAILSSIPSWQDEAFIYSPYATNKVSSLASLLKTEGYQSSFFHGGKNGTMGFNAFIKAAEFDNYYGKNEYNNNKDYDGNWGIWDEPFLQFTADKLAQTKQPFISSVFTLNNHHPFNIPEKYKTTFQQNGHPILSCVQYTDMALARFFEKAKTMDWFKNTLFVITADHASPVFYASKRPALQLNYNIPIVFYKPDNSLKGTSTTIANQIDILPSVLDLLHYPNAYFSFGTNLFNKDCTHFSINYNASIYQYIDSSYCYQFNGKNGIGLYQWQTDSSLSKNLYVPQQDSLYKNADLNLKQKIQVFNNSMEDNNMNIPQKK
jgi:phosphoglycerol transferase MdoB-like AlkP superfamily enzyme